MVAQTQLRYEAHPQTVVYFATTKALKEGRPILGSRNNAVLWLQDKGLFLPTSLEWSERRAYLERHNPEMERDMITGASEYVDDMIFWPNPETGKYSSELNPQPNSGRYPLRVAHSFLDKRNDGSTVYDGGEREELPDFPKTSGALTKDILRLGLIEGKYLVSNDDFGREEGARALIRGYWGWVARERRFYAFADGWPSDPGWFVGFRPVKRGLVVGEKIEFPRSYLELAEQR